MSAAAGPARLLLHESAVHLAEGGTCSESGRLGEGILELSVGLLLNGLCVLQLLNQLHLKHFHLHDFLLLRTNHGFFLYHPLFHFSFRLHLFSSNEFLLLKLGNPLLLFNHLVLLLCVQLSLGEEYILPLFILDLYDTLLFDFLLFGEVYGLLNLLSFDLALPPHLVDPLLILLLHHLLHSQLLHLLLNLNLVLLLESENLCSTFLCFFDLFPCTHFFLLKEGDTVGEELRISLNAIYQKHTG